MGACAEVRQQAILQELQTKLEGKSAIGAFLLEGGLGSGQSHPLTFLCHLFTAPDRAQKWLTANGKQYLSVGGLGS